MTRALRACVVIACFVGCTIQSDGKKDTEFSDEYERGNAALTVKGAGDWSGTEASLVFSYRQGDQRSQLTVDFAAWSATGNAAVAPFFAGVDQALLGDALATLRVATSDGSAQAAFRHFQVRILSAVVPHEHGAAEAGECYCYQCQIHHPPECIKKDTKDADLEQAPNIRQDDTLGHSHDHVSDDTSALSEAGECYCYSCQIHHPPECIKKDAN